MKALFTALLTVFSINAQADSFPGKYQIVVDGGVIETVKLEFLVNSQNELRALRIQKNGSWEDAGFTDTSIALSADINSSGPFLQHLTIGFTYGSDEDGFVTYVSLAWLGEGSDNVLTQLNSLTLYQDGPNDVAMAFKDLASVYKWDRASQSYKKLTSL